MRYPGFSSHNQIAMIASEVLGAKPRITHILNWIRVAVLNIVRFFTGSKLYGPIEFFMTVMAIDMIAPEYGSHTLKEFFSYQRHENG